MPLVRYLGRNITGKSHGTPEIFSTSERLEEQYEAEGAKECRDANSRIQKAVKKAKEDCRPGVIVICNHDYL